MSIPEHDAAHDQDVLAKAAKSHHDQAVMQWPETRRLLARMDEDDCDHDHISNAQEDAERMQAISKFLKDFGPAAFDRLRKDLSKQLTNAAHTAVYIHSANLQLVLAAGTLVKELDYYNLFRNRALVIEMCHIALNIHGANMDVQPLFRTVLFGMGHLELDQASLALVKSDLAKAQAYMSDPVNVKPTLIMQCLARLELNANFVIMHDQQQTDYKEAVAGFALWCLARTILRAEDTLLFGEDEIARQACALVHKVAAGCMQQDDDSLFESDRLFLRSNELPQLLFQLQNVHRMQYDVHPDPGIEWLFRRVKMTDRVRAESLCEAHVDEPAAKRSRAAGGSA